MTPTKSLALAATLALAASLAFAPAAHATDGVILITQATATTGLPGCPNDGQSLITICRSGSYRLAGNIVVNSNQDGFDISSTDVTFDLNGFTISTPGQQGLFAGIFGRMANVAVEDGMIDGFFEGLELDGIDEAVRNVSVSDASYGLTVLGGLVQGCNVAVTGVGLSLSLNSVVDHCVISGDNEGIDVRGSSSQITNCVIQSTGNGINVDSGGAAQVSGSTISGYYPIYSSGQILYGNDIVDGTVGGPGMLDSLHTSYCGGAPC